MCIADEIDDILHARMVISHTWGKWRAEVHIFNSELIGSDNLQNDHHVRSLKKHWNSSAGNGTEDSKTLEG